MNDLMLNTAALLLALLTLLLGLGLGLFTGLRLGERIGLGRHQAMAERDAQDLQSSQAQLAQQQAELQSLRQLLAQTQTQAAQSQAQLETQLQAERQQSAEKIALLQEARQSLTDQFKALANEILEEKSKRFAEQNQTSLGQLLDPLRQRITEFQQKVDDVYVKESKDRSALQAQVGELMKLNQTVGAEANRLVNALKGSNKTQGNWGEMVLERILEQAGLRKDADYTTQTSFTRPDGSRAQPDVIVNLPGQRQIIIDAKVSITAYQEYCNAQEDSARRVYLQSHVASLREHVRGLSERSYESLSQVQSLDFVVLFVPIEPAFLLAAEGEPELFQQAWDKNVLIVSPSTLLFVLRTVAYLWRQEDQSNNAKEIARRGAELYDKLHGFVTDLEDVGNRLNQAQGSFEKAHAKLISGKGSVTRQAEMLRELGVKPKKQFKREQLGLSLTDSGEANDSDETSGTSETSDGQEPEGSD